MTPHSRERGSPQVFSDETSALEYLSRRNDLLAAEYPKIALRYRWVLARQPVVRLSRRPISKVLEESSEGRTERGDISQDSLDASINKNRLPDHLSWPEMTNHVKGLTNDKGATANERTQNENLNLLPFDADLESVLNNILDMNFLNEFEDYNEVSQQQSLSQLGTSDSLAHSTLSPKSVIGCSSAPQTPPQCPLQRPFHPQLGEKRIRVCPQFSRQRHNAIDYRLIRLDLYGIVQQSTYKRPRSYETAFKDVNPKRPALVIPLKPLKGIHRVDPREKFLVSKTKKNAGVYDQISSIMQQAPVLSLSDCSEKISSSYSTSSTSSIPPTPSIISLSPPYQANAVTVKQRLDSPTSSYPAASNPTVSSTKAPLRVESRPISLSVRITAGQFRQSREDSEKRSLDQRQLHEIVTNIEIDGTHKLREEMPMGREEIMTRSKIDSMLLNTHISLDQINRGELKRIVRSTKNNLRI